LEVILELSIRSHPLVGIKGSSFVGIKGSSLVGIKGSSLGGIPCMEYTAPHGQAGASISDRKEFPAF